jgi:hypothetical protein
LALFIMIVAGLVLPKRSPDQLEKAQPAAGTAVTRTVEPLACGLEVLVEIEPLPTTLVVRM